MNNINGVRRIKFLFVTALVLAESSACSGGSRLGPINQSTEIDILVPSVKDIYPEANQLALNWNSDALLMQIQVEIVNPSTSFIQNPRILLTYESKNLINETYGVTCKDNKCTGRSSPIPNTLLSSDVTPIAFELVKVDSSEAVQIALDNGGTEYIRSQESFDLANLRSDDDGNLHWVVSLSSQNGETFSITVDSETGDVISIIDA